MKPHQLIALGAAVLHAVRAGAGPLVVSFDANGGTLEDDIRVVRTGGTYGENVNLYPNDSASNFADLPSSKITLSDGVFSYSTSERWCNYWTRPITNILAGRRYTYIVDILTYSNTSSSAPWLNIGQTHSDQSAQLVGTSFQVASTGRYFRVLSGRVADRYSLLGRDYVDFNHSDSGVCSMTFRVQLYAGKDSVPADGAFAASGECAAMPLPVPTWTDHVFLGWTNNLGEAVTDATVVTNAESHVLGAAWKEWRVQIAGSERPRPGTPLVASTNYGDDGESGVVSFKWQRGDWAGSFVDVSEGAEYVPSDADYEHFLKAVLRVDGNVLAEKSLWFSKLPVVYIDTSDGADITVKTDEKTSNVRVQGNAEFKQQYNGLAFVKGRGNSSWGFPKKPYKVKLDKKTDMFGFGKQKHWVLLANYIDVSSMRNKTAYDMSGAFGLVYQDSTWVEVVFNGRFDGMYQFCEHVRVDKTRVNIFNWEDEVEDEEDLSSIDPATTDITGGYLWELSDEYDEVSKFKIDVTGNGETGEDIPVMFNRPEFACTNPSMMEWCSNFWQDVYASWTSLHNTTPDGSRSWDDLCDIDSMVSYWLVNEIFGNDDAWYKSRYCYKDIGGKLTFGPVWDCDWGLGSVVVGTNDVARWRLARENNSGWPVSFYKQWLDDPWFCLKALEKYREMRPMFAELFADGGEYDANAVYLREAGLAEDARWGAERTATYGANKRTQAGDTATFKWWMQTRLAWLDAQFADLDTLVASVYNHESALPFVRTPGTVSVNGSREREVTIPQDADADVRVSVSDGKVETVDVMLNGRLFREGIAVTGGACSFRVGAFGDGSVSGETALLAVMARRGDGSVAVRDYVTLRAVVRGGFRMILR